MSWVQRLHISAQSRQSLMQATIDLTSVSFKQAVAQLSQATTHSWQAVMLVLYCIGVMDSAAEVVFGSTVAKAIVNVKRVRLMRFIGV